MEKSEEYIKARERIIKYILYKSRTSSEVYNKLIDLQFSEGTAKKVTEDLTELGYINDKEYIKKFIESNKKAKKFSKSMIKLKLQNKGIDKETIDKFLYECEFSDFEAIKEALRKKHFSDELPFDEKNKIKAYCLRKGFNTGDIIKVIREVYENKTF